jgi:hypothetical protein
VLFVTALLAIELRGSLVLEAKINALPFSLITYQLCSWKIHGAFIEGSNTCPAL